MSEQFRKKSFMDYRNVVPFMDLSGFVVKQPHILEEKPALSLREQLLKKKFSNMINIRRLQYYKLVGEYKNGRK